MNTTMQQTAFPFQPTTSPLGYESEAERRFLLGLVRAGWMRHDTANDNGDSPPTWGHPRLPKTVLFAQLDLEHILGIQHVVDYCFRSYSTVCRNLVVEIDGDRWHASPTQVARDKRFDRMIHSSEDGWVVHRYPAREILDPRLCDQAIRTVHHQLRQTGMWIPRARGPTASLG